MVKSDTDEQCVICDDLKSLYKKICASCFLRGFQLDGSIVGIKPNEVYLHIINRNFNNFTFKELEPIKHLKTYLFDIFIKKTHILIRFLNQNVVNVKRYMTETYHMKIDLTS